MPSISVIIPVYNVADYVVASVNSVRQQTLQDIEIICVNDGSTDASLAWLKILAAVDDRIVVINKENGGLSSARNAGIKAATADLVCFLDSDDLLERNACQTIVSAFYASDIDLVTYGATAYPEMLDYPWLNTVLSPRSVEYIGFDPDLLFKENSRPFAWRTACRKAFLEGNNLWFDESVAFGEDQVFHFAAYPRSTHTVLIPDALLKYRVSRTGSLMHSQREIEKRLTAHFEITRVILNDWVNAGFLPRYNEDMLTWTFDFLGRELLESDYQKKDQLIADYIALLDKMGLIKIESPSSKSASLLLDAYHASKLNDRKIVHQWQLRRAFELEGKLATLKRLTKRFCVKLCAPIHRIQRKNREFATSQSELELSLWEASDSQARMHAAQSLLAEYQTIKEV